MSKYIDAEKLIAEIERNRQAIRVLNEVTAPEHTSKTCAIFQYSDKILSELLSFIGNLSEEPDKSLGEAAENYIAPIENDEGLDYINFNGRDIKDAFIAGAEWQKEKDTRDMYMSDNRHFQKVYELGKKDIKEQMMKNAISCKVFWYDGPKLDYTQEQQDDVLEKIGAAVDDNVQVIILKDDGKSD